MVEKVDVLKKKLEQLRILDPSCGSGAFLTKAVDVLMDIYDEIKQYEINRNLYKRPFNLDAEEYHREEQSRIIIERNLFGIDLNPRAVDVAKLSLFFKIVTKSKKLPDMTSDIVEGNTISGPTLDDIRHKNKKFIEMNKFGGFDIILGNPPYVEDGKLDYKTNADATKDCGNTYAYFLEKGIKMLKPGGRLGYIVPVAAVSTPRMAPLQKFLTDGCSELKISNFDDRPGKLFEGLEDCRSSIILCTKKESKSEEKKCRVYTTGYNRWYSENVVNLFKNLSYVEHTLLTNTYIPKLSNEMETSIMKKIFMKVIELDGIESKKNKLQKTDTKKDECMKIKLGKFISDSKTEYSVIYHNAPRYWIRGMDFMPHFSNKNGMSQSAHNKILYVNSENAATVLTGLLNSSLFYWFFVKTSNCRDLTGLVIGDFPMNPEWADVHNMAGIVRRLMLSYRENSVRKNITNKKTGDVQYDEFYPKKSKTIIDEIDDAFAKYYGMSEDEAKYIKTFDHQFRMGKNSV